jgi:xylan 1,4-beta-xylosidase
MKPTVRTSRLFLVALLSASAAEASSAQDKGAPHLIRNPILRGFNPDPSILRVGDDYYIATSTFEWFPGVRIHHSRDLVHWRLLAHPLTRRSQLDMLGNPASGGIWAPCLSFRDGVFYLVFTDVKNCSGGFVDAHNYLVTAKDITGPWSDPAYLNSSGFDPSLFHDEDGRTWLLNMTWNFRSNNKSGGIVLQELDLRTKSLVGKSTLIFRGTEAGGTEGPHIYRRGGYYHLMTAEGGTGYGHQVTMARSKTITGPYELDPGNPILTSKTDASLVLQKAGHASLVQTQKGEWYLAYLCGRPLPGTKFCNLGRETAIQPCFWNEAGWLRLDGGKNLPIAEAKAPNLPLYPFSREPTKDDFDEPGLSLHFNTLREPPEPSWLSLTERPGHLRLRGRESLTSRFRQSVVARRVQAFRCEAVTRVEFAPENYQQMAGLLCSYDDRNWVYLRMSYDEEAGTNLAVLQEEKGKLDLGKPVMVEKDKAWFLKAVFDYGSLRFFYSTDGQEWRRIGGDYDAGKLSDDYCNGFTGTFVGMAVQDLGGARKHADFDFFEYRERQDEER